MYHVKIQQSIQCVFVVKLCELHSFQKKSLNSNCDVSFVFCINYDIFHSVTNNLWFFKYIFFL